LGFYEEFYKIFASLTIGSNNEFCELSKLCKAIIEFDKTYHSYSNMEYRPYWLKKRLLQQVDKTEQEFLNINSFYKADDLNPTQTLYYEQSKAFIKLHNYLKDQYHEVYIIGHERLVNEFSTFNKQNESYSYKIQNVFPFYQAHRNGYIYTIPNSRKKV
jgi:hypothetical protein